MPLIMGLMMAINLAVALRQYASGGLWQAGFHAVIATIILGYYIYKNIHEASQVVNQSQQEVRESDLSKDSTD